MSLDKLETFLKYKPDCACFADEDGLKLRVAQSVQIGQYVGATFGSMCDDNGICTAAMSHVLDDAIMNIATIIAIRGTIIECGSEEAERETVRVLAGIEARLLDKLREVHALAREEMAEGRFRRMNGRGEIVK